MTQLPHFPQHAKPWPLPTRPHLYKQAASYLRRKADHIRQDSPPRLRNIIKVEAEAARYEHIAAVLRNQALRRSKKE